MCDWKGYYSLPTKWCKICVRVATNVAKEGNPSWPPKSKNETSVRHISYVNTHVWHSGPERWSPDQARRTGVTTHRTLNCDWTRCHLTAQQGVTSLQSNPITEQALNTKVYCTLSTRSNCDAAHILIWITASCPSNISLPLPRVAVLPIPRQILKRRHPEKHL